MFNKDLFIKGGVFNEPTRLPGLVGRRMNIVFGRNGSGKSTIARAFREQQPDYQSLNPIRHYELSSDNSGSLPPEICSHLFVFNEEFIDDNVKVKDGLKTIIRIGSSATLDAPIQDGKDKILELKDLQKPIKDKLNILNGSADGSVSQADDELRKGLKKPGGYMDRLYRIDGKQKLVTGLLDPVLYFNRSDTLPYSIGETAKRLEEDIARYLSFKSGSVINWSQPNLPHVPSLTEVNDLLAQSVRPAELTDEEKMILDELSKGLAAEDFIPKTERLVVHGALGFCPLCHQPVSDDYKHTLEQRLFKFRDRSVQQFKDKVNGILSGISFITISLPPFPTRDYDADIDVAGKRLSELNEFLSRIKTALEKKEANPFTPMSGFDRDSFVALISESRKALTQLSDDVATYNSILQEKDRLKKDIDRMNVRLAYHENKSWIDAYNDRFSRRLELNNQFRDIEERINEQKREIDKLSAQIDQVDDAREQINHYLDIIFGVNRLRLTPAGKDKYKLQVKQGENFTDIPPKAISSGERNALALAYFFACTMEKKDRNYNYSDPTLLVIDDPISSFDAENKAGVLSLLSMQIKKVLNGNPDSQVLVFTHDFTTLRELCDQRSRLFPNEKNEIDQFLRIKQDHSIKGQNCSVILENMEYYNDLQAIFDFARCQDPDEFAGYDAMGNSIRGFAESYATRMFKCKWMDLFTEDKYLDCLAEDIRESVRSFAIRPVLNSESHGVFASFEPAEVQRAARVLLVYMYYATYMHLYAYLVGFGKKSEQNNGWKMEAVEKWVDEF